jgi:hypothetical protein
MRIKGSKTAAITITRSALRANKLVYIAVANKTIRYPQGRSHIVYIGTTKAGARRIAQSAASKAEQLLNQFGLNTLHFHVLTASKIPGLKSWRLLERALILRFREKFGRTPRANVVGKNMRWDDELEYLTHQKLDKVIDSLS